MYIVEKISTKYKNLRRYKQIVEVMGKYGFDFFVRKLYEKELIPQWLVKKGKIATPLSPGKRLRLALEELGPTFIKLGQILSTRPDIISEDIILELSKLQDCAPEFPFATVKKIFRDEMGLTIEEAFADFEKEPMAAASIGQVHKARLRNNRDVVIKIQRPNIRELMESDFHILINLAKIFDEYFNDQFVFKMLDIVEEFKKAISRELDYTIEARNIEKFRENYKNNKQIVIPCVYWQYTSKKILTIEEIHGTKIVDMKSSNEQDYDVKSISELIAGAFIRQVFIDGLFHADPHPGNIFIISSQRIAFIDFGSIGYLDKNTKTFITDLFIASARRDIEKIIKLLIENDSITEESEIRRLKEDISFALDFYFNTPLRMLDVREAISEFMAIAYRNKVILPTQFTLLAKAMITLEGCVKILNPDFSIGSITALSMHEIMLYRLNPKEIAYESITYVEEILNTLKKMPRNLQGIIKKLEQKEIKLTLEQTELHKLQRQLDKISNKISLSLIISAIILSSSFMMQSTKGPRVWGISIFGLLGYFSAILLGFIFVAGMILSIVRKNKN